MLDFSHPFAAHSRTYFVQAADHGSKQGLGKSHIQSSVPSPVLNVLCAELTESELTPMVYTKWPTFNGTVPNGSTWPADFDLHLKAHTRTAVDNLFGFGEDQAFPIFAKVPLAYNTLFNYSITWGPAAVYLLATSPTNSTTLCSLKSALTPDCSTSLSSSDIGKNLTTDCSAKNPLAFRHSDPSSRNGRWEQNWKDVASVWGVSMSLNNGIDDGKASNARLLTELIPTSHTLNSSKPSIAEALAVLAGGTVLQSAVDSPFISTWNYSMDDPVLSKPVYQSFNATVKTMEYQSGGTREWQKGFYIVLSLMVIGNICCLGYFLRHKRSITDFLELQNLFCLSFLSPPGKVLEGACGAGPGNAQYATKWNIKVDESRDHLYFESHTDGRDIHTRKWKHEAAAAIPHVINKSGMDDNGNTQQSWEEEVQQALTGCYLAFRSVADPNMKRLRRWTTTRESMSSVETKRFSDVV